MCAFVLSAFGDEIDPMLDTQMDVLEQHGIRFIETRGVDGVNVSMLTPEQAEDAASRMKARGFGVSALGSPIGKIGVDEDFDAHMEVLRNAIAVAKVFETPFIRAFSFYIPEGENPADYRDEVMRRMGIMIAEAEKAGITLLHENEKGIYGDNAARCAELFERFKGRLFCTYDPSNFGNVGEDNRAAFPLLRPYIRYMHIKDSLNKTRDDHRDRGFERVGDNHRPAGQGDCDVPWILENLHGDSYDGFLSIEPHLSTYEGIPGTGADKFAAAASALKGLLDNMGAVYS